MKTPSFKPGDLVWRINEYHVIEPGIITSVGRETSGIFNDEEISVNPLVANLLWLTSLQEQEKRLKIVLKTMPNMTPPHLSMPFTNIKITVGK